MVNRLVSVGDDFTLPPSVKAADENLPDRLQVGELNATYGSVDIRVAPPSGSAATDTANWQAAIAACPAGGMIEFGQSALGVRQYDINATLVINKSLTIRGFGCNENYLNGQSNDYPTGTPRLRGSLLNVVTAGIDAVKVTALASTVNLADFGVIFDAAIAGNTGHGFNCDSGAADQTLREWVWRRLKVFGHDGNHYGFRWRNVCNGYTEHLRTYGGGGFLTIVDHPALNLGNGLHAQPYAAVMYDGTAHSFAQSSLNSTGPTGILNLTTYVRPQSMVLVATTNSQSLWNDKLGAGIPADITVIAPNFEAGDYITVGSGTEFIGGHQYLKHSANTFYGYPSAGVRSGGNNAGFGGNQFQALTTGNSNAACGYGAFLGLTTGSANVAIGRDALAALVSGSNSTAVGRSALAATTGAENTAVGSGAATSTAGTNDSTMLGRNAQAGTSGIAVGHSATASGTSAVAIGRGATASYNGSVAIGRDASNASAATTTTNQIMLGTAAHTVVIPGILEMAGNTSPLGDVPTDSLLTELSALNLYSLADGAALVPYRPRRGTRLAALTPTGGTFVADDGGLPALSFTTSLALAAPTWNASYTGPITMFAVYKIVTFGDTAGSGWYPVRQSSSAGYRMKVGQDGSVSISGNNTATVAAAASVTSGAWRVDAFQINANDWSYWGNSATTPVTGTGTGSTPALTGLGVGGTSGTSNAWVARSRIALAYQGALPASTVTRIIQYLDTLKAA